VTVTDGAGWSQEVDFPIRVGNGIAIFGPIPPAALARFMANWRPLDATPVQQARTALGTRAVRFVKAHRRRAGVRAAQGAACLVSAQGPGADLPVRCTLTSRASVAGRTSSPLKQSVAPGRAAGLGLALSSAAGRQVVRSGGARATFRLAVSRPGHKTRRATVRVTPRG